MLSLRKKKGGWKKGVRWRESGKENARRRRGGGQRKRSVMIHKVRGMDERRLDMKEGTEDGGRECCVRCPGILLQSTLFIAAPHSSRVTYIAHHLHAITHELLK